MQLMVFALSESRTTTLSIDRVQFPLQAFE